MEVDSVAKLAQNHWINGDFRRVRPQPFEHVCRRIGAGDLAQHIRIDKEFHRLSVDSDSTGVK